MKKETLPSGRIIFIWGKEEWRDFILMETMVIVVFVAAFILC